MQLATGVVQRANDFKYLGNWMQQESSMNKKMGVRRGRAWNVFQSFEKYDATRN